MHEVRHRQFRLNALFFGDGKSQALTYAGEVLDAFRDGSALVPGIWGFEVSNVIARAEAKGFVTEARSEIFLGMLKRDGHRSG